MSVTTEARSTVRTLLRWAPTFAAFPVGGLAATCSSGPSPPSAPPRSAGS